MVKIIKVEWGLVRKLIIKVYIRLETERTILKHCTVSEVN